MWPAKQSAKEKLLGAGQSEQSGLIGTEALESGATNNL